MRTGKLTAFVGVMGCGKTDRMISIYNQCLEKGLRTVIFKPSLDTRVDGEIVKSRSGKVANARSIKTIEDIYYFEEDYDTFDVILIDEIQFFNEPDIIHSLVAINLLGIDVYVFGLDLTSDATPFGRVSEIMAHADQVIKLETKCARCENNARISHYTGQDKDGDVKVGDLDVYEPLCRDCYYMDEVGVAKSIENLTTEESMDGLVEHFHTFNIKNEEFKLELVVPKTTLEDAGYTYDDVVDIGTIEGVRNLLLDLGYSLDDLDGGANK